MARRAHRRGGYRSRNGRVWPRFRVQGVQDYKAKHNESLFARSSAAVRTGTLNRATAEKNALLRLDASQTTSSTVPKVPSANVPSSAPPSVPPVPDAQIPERLNGGGSQPIQVQIADKTRQDVGNRRIAHLASGGISAA